MKYWRFLLKTRHSCFYLILLFVPIILFSCKDAAVPDPYTVGSLSLDYNSIEPVYEIDFGSDNELAINLSGTFSGQNMFLVKMNSNDFIVDSESAGYVKTEIFSRSLFSADTKTTTIVKSTFPIKKDHLESMNFLDLHKPSDNTGIFVPSRSVVPVKEATIEYGTVGTPLIDSTKDFWVENSSGSFITITAILKSVGEYGYIWVPAVNFDDSSSSDTDNLLTQGEIDTLSIIFDGSAGNNYDDGIYELVTNVFGYEYGGGLAGDGGKDGDKHVNILIYDIDYDALPDQPGGVFGYFWGKDYYDDAYTSSNWNLRSNESEIFYIDSYFLDKYPDGVYSTLAHEFQHMIHFNRKFIEKGMNSATWYNEMLSMLSEDIMQDKLGISDASSPIGRSSDFVDGYYKSGVTDWLSGTDVYYSYASAFLFGAFLTRNYGGADLIKAMLDSNSVNQSSVSNALTSLGYSESFSSVYNKYSTALLYSVEDSSNNILVTNKTSSVLINSVTYSQKAFDIYNYTNSSSYNGPVLFYTDYKLALRPSGMSIHSDDPWSGLTGVEKLSFNIVAPVSGVKYYLMFR